jgi:hypothetical protein
MVMRWGGTAIWGIKYGYPIDATKQALFYPAGTTAAEEAAAAAAQAEAR